MKFDDSLQTKAVSIVMLYLSIIHQSLSKNKVSEQICTF